MTTIRASEYTANAGQQLNPLSEIQVGFLNRGAIYDISQKVRTVVQKYIGYQGTDEFKANFTKQQITFNLTNGNVNESRTLVLQSGHWKLSQNNAHVKDLDPAVADEVNTLVTEILSNIGRASAAIAPAPADPVAGVVAQPENPVRPVANVDELTPIRERLTALEGELRANPTLERSLQVQQEILRILATLREELSRHAPENHAETETLRQQVAGLQQALAAKETAFNKFLMQGQAEFDRINAAAKEEIESKQARIKQLEDLITQTEKRIAEKEQVCDDATYVINGAKELLQGHVSALEAEVVKLQKKETEITLAASQEITELKSQISKKAEIIRNRDAVLGRFEKDLKDSKALLEKLQAQYDKELKSLETELNELEAKSAQQAKQAYEQIAALTAQTDELASQLKSAQSKLEAAIAATGDAQKAASELAQLQSAHEALLANNEKRQVAYDTLATRNDDLLGQLRDAEALADRVPSLEEENSKLQDGIRVAQKVLERLIALEQQNKEASQRIEALQLENSALGGKLIAADTQNRASSLRIQDLEAFVAEKERELDAVKKTAQIAQATIEKEKQRAFEAENKLSDATDRLKEANLTVEYTESLRSQAAKAHGQALVKITDLEAANKKLSLQEDETYSLLVETGKRSEDREQELQDLKAKLETMRTEKQKKVETAGHTLQVERKKTATVTQEVDDLLKALPKMAGKNLISAVDTGTEL